ncbi:uncharacterized protein LOC112398283 [Neophocaena asiaeorientalis asiaeorientalis]|uniref:Uncharacterized protein LOC112398283 n=1 Tax=Neophocaena asiaeorientalis asiaeorientalis TaxID=1706337 RepID=A0A341B8I7_NEOAA|nr:uncharacterized protein LOC112398283 [Neophocaena asiaeorientalis asiaeorientalis]
MPSPERLTKSKASLPLPLSEVTRGCSEGSWPLPPTPALSGEGTAYSPRVSETPPGHLHTSTDQSCLPRDAPATQLGAELSNKQHLCPPPAEPCTVPLPHCRRGGEPTAANLVHGAGASPHHGSCPSHRTERKSPPCHAPTASCPGFQGLLSQEPHCPSLPLSISRVFPVHQMGPQISEPHLERQGTFHLSTPASSTSVASLHISGCKQVFGDRSCHLTSRTS